MTRHTNDVLIGQRLPSLKQACPRCRRQMQVSSMDSGVMLEACPEGHYEARTVTGESRLAWQDAVQANIRLGHGRLRR